MSARLGSAMAALAVVLVSTAASAQTAEADAGDRPDGSDIVVTAQKENRTQVIRGGQLGILGDKAAADVPFSVKSYNEALILNQQPLTLGQVLENDPTIRTTYGFGNAAEQFVIRGFTLYADDIALDGLYGITPRQLVAPELYSQVQVLNGASGFLNGAAPGGSAIGGSVNLVSKRAGASDLARLTGDYVSGKHFGGAFDVSHRFGADQSLGVRINGALRGGDVSIDDEYRRTTVIGGAIDYTRGDVTLTLDAAYQLENVHHLRPKVTIATATIPRVPSASHNYAQRFTYSRLRDIFGIARAEWRFAPDALAYAQFGARDGAERGIYDGISITNAVTGAATGSALFVPRTDNNEAAQAGMRVKLATHGITNEFNLGGNHIWQVEMAP